MSGPLAVVAHDAGGAELLSSFLARTPRPHRVCLAGPARAIFERKLEVCEPLSLEEALEGCSELLCGTSWQSEWELDAIAAARARRLPCTAWLDHWVNFRTRFMRRGRLQLPDRVWVSDETALAVARRELPEVPLRLVDNPYLDDVDEQLRAAARRPRGAAPAVLYVCEPVREPAQRLFGDPLHFGYAEEDALRFFLDNLPALGRPPTSIVLRRHPAEGLDKYVDIAAAYALPIEFSEGGTLAHDLAACDIVVGCASMALAVAARAGKRVVTSIPPGGPACPLPQPQIESLRTLVERAAAAQRWSRNGRASRKHAT